MRLSVIVPCYNEAGHIADVLKAIDDVDLPDFEKEIIVVDDGSTDDTARILREHKADGNLVLHFCEKNSGKGAAIRAGLQYVTGDIIIIQDADLEYDPQQYPEIVRPIANGEADVVYGSRFLGHIEGMRLRNRIANYVLAWTTNILFNAHITDEATCYKAFRADVLKSLSLRCMKFEFCPEVTAKVRKRGIAIKEVPISYVGRCTAQGKKIKWTDAFEAMWALIKYRLVD